MLINVQHYIEKHNLLNHEKPIIVGLSGGADSVALLYLLKRLNYDCIAVHCNFYLRGEESDRDEAFVIRLTNDWNIPLYKTTFDTVRVAFDRKISIEMAARDLRYEWFEGIRKQEGAQAICVAHHRDDNIETLLINLIRGTGIRGLSGIRPKNGYLVRPLLDFSQQEILDYVEENKLPYVIDSTNLKPDFTRNKIRLEVLPLLETINPSIKESIGQTITNLDATRIIYQDAIEKAKREVFNLDENSISIPGLTHSLSPETLLFEILREYGFNPDVIREIYQALNAQSGKEFYSLTHRLIKDRDILFLLPLQVQSTDEYLLYESSDYIDYPFKIDVCRKENHVYFEIKREAKVAYLDVDLLQFPLKLRRWKNGDRFMPFGMNHFQKLSDFFNNNKFSKPQKENVWLLTSGDDIVWVINYRIDHRYRITERTKKVIILEVH